VLDYASIDLHYPAFQKKSSSLSKTKSRNSERKKKVEGSAVTQWWQLVYWFDSASECPQCFQKRELVILIATTSSNRGNEKEISRRED